MSDLSKTPDQSLNSATFETLRSYVVAADALPTTATELEKSTKVTPQEYKVLQPKLDPLIAQYAKSKKSASVLKNITFPTVNNVMREIQTYASSAADDYLIIKFLLSTLTPTSDELTITTTLTSIKTKLQARITTAQQIQQTSTDIYTQLTQFQNTTIQEDEPKLKELQKAVNDMLAGEKGRLRLLANQIMIFERQANLDRMKGIYSSTATHQVTLLQGCVVGDKMLQAHIGAIDTQLDNLVNLIGPAITEVQLMMGTWHAVAADLGSIANLLNKEDKDLSTKAGAILAGFDETKVRCAWKALADKAVAFLDKL